jgi:hypothetical protein
VLDNEINQPKSVHKIIYNNNIYTVGGPYANRIISSIQYDTNKEGLPQAKWYITLDDDTQKIYFNTIF